MISNLATFPSKGRGLALSSRTDTAQFETDVFLERMVEACASNLAVLDESGEILYASRAWQLSEEQNALWPKTQRQGSDPEYIDVGMTGLSLRECLDGDIRRLLDNHQREFHRECSGVGPRGERWFIVDAARLDVPESGGFRILITREDFTRRRQAEAELRDLGGRLIAAQEQERGRIARELHDDLNQRMAILAIEMDQLRQKLPPAQSDLVGSFERLYNKAREISLDIHRLSYQLHPAKLDHLGLSVALEGLCEELSEHHQIDIEFQQSGFPAEVPKDITLCIFRIGQESLRNVIKHSGSPDARVVLKKTAHAIHLHISDNGCGFDVDAADGRKGLGLIGMKERLRLVDGNISIRSQLFRGTHIDVLVPLRAESQAKRFGLPE